ncbi:MAG TPA: glycosyltransferase [Solirubrobacteraceae bacterium]
MNGEATRYIVLMPGEPSWELPAAGHGPCAGGGHRALHELAVAIAATGRAVEVRGEFDLDELRTLAAAAGGGPELPREPRRPRADDVILMPEGITDPLIFGLISLSSARKILLVLGPPGLAGWPFSEGWSLRPPVAVEVDEVARPEHFRAMAGMGFELWANSPGLVERIEAAGVPGRWIGVGRPLPFPDPLPKRYDVVTLANNRWSELAAQVVSRLDPEVVRRQIPAVSNDEVLRQFGQSRVLVHPLQVEGDSRIGQEARAMGAVPVVLNSNPFSVGLNEEGGAVAVSSLGEMPETVMALLRDPERLDRLRERGMRTTRDQFDWDRHLLRLDEALRHPRTLDPAAQARGIIGAAVRLRERSLVEHVEAEKTTELELLRGRLEWEHEVVAADLAAANETIRTIHGTRVWRLAGRFWKLRDRMKSAFGGGRRSPR